MLTGIAFFIIGDIIKSNFVSIVGIIYIVLWVIKILAKLYERFN